MKRRPSVVKTVILLIFVFAIAAALFYTGGKRVLTKTTYTEYQALDSDFDELVSATSTESGELSWEFHMPFDIMSDIGIRIESSARAVNSVWNVEVLRKSDESVLYTGSIEDSSLEEAGYTSIHIPRNLLLNKDDTYIIRVVPEAASAEISTDTVGLMLYGCDQDMFWQVLYLFIWFILVILGVWSAYLFMKGKNPIRNRGIQSYILFILVFCMFYAFSRSGIYFMDENDNIRGGMIIAKGGVLYRDYISQHTPVSYYLCAVFALLGAQSVEQFRICFYFVLAGAFALLYLRHSSYWSGKRLYLMAIGIVITVTTLYTNGHMILSDTVQGICLLALLMEFLRYYYERTMSLGRCVIVSLSVWGSFGAAFISAYAISIIVIAVVCIEVYDWIKGKYQDILPVIFGRYVKLGVVSAIPFGCFVIYFWMQGALGLAYDFAYRFNREVYTIYNGGMGESVVEPYMIGVKTFWLTIKENLNALSAEVTTEAVLMVLIAALVGVILIYLLLRKRFFLSVVLFLFLSCNLTRGYGFHSMAFWYVAIAVIFLCWPKAPGKKVMAVYAILLAALALYFVPVYAGNVSENLFKEQEKITDNEHFIVSITEDQESIFLDTTWTDSIYLLYKNRYPVNRITYNLPWYMDWCEEMAIEDLTTEMPRVMIYNPDLDVWGTTQFTPDLHEAASQYYNRLPLVDDEVWRQCIWIRKDVVLE